MKGSFFVEPGVWISQSGAPAVSVAGLFKVTHQNQLCFLIESQDLSKLLLFL